MMQEYSIACLLDEPSIRQLKDSIPFLDNENHPHVSLFQFRSRDEDFLNYIKSQLKNFYLSNPYLTGRVSQVEKNVYLDIVDDLTLQKASDKLADIYSVCCDHKEPLSQIKIMQLDAEKMHLVSTYGNYWVKQNYRPHVTLLYHKQPPDLTVMPPVSVTLQPAEIYVIDPMGRIVGMK